MNSVAHDVIIIGAGPAGLTAGIYAAREMFDTLLLEGGICGGLVANTDLIENYPGFPEGLNGRTLIDKFRAQAERFAVKIREFEAVEEIKSEGKIIKVKTNKHQHNARAVIVASGGAPKKLAIPGEDKLCSKGVSYCATCDGPLFKGKDVLVVGGGNAAAEEALFLTKFAESVTLVHRRNELRAAKILQDQLRKNKKINLLLSHIAVSINGENCVNFVTVKDLQNNTERKVPASGVFIYVGFLPNTKFLKGVVELDDKGYVKTNELMQTNVPGIYAAGDVRSKSVRQIITACAEGTTAAISARDYIRNL